MTSRDASPARATGPFCRRNCVASDRACTRVTPQNFHGKEGVNGSSPLEGLPKIPANRNFVVVFSPNTRTHSGHIFGTRDARRLLAASSDTSSTRLEDKGDQEISQLRGNFCCPGWRDLDPFPTGRVSTVRVHTPQRVRDRPARGRPHRLRRLDRARRRRPRNPARLRRHPDRCGPGRCRCTTPPAPPTRPTRSHRRSYRNPAPLDNTPGVNTRGIRARFPNNEPFPRPRPRPRREQSSCSWTGASGA